MRALVGAVTLVCSAAALGQTVDAAQAQAQGQSCSKEQDATARLACYDRVFEFKSDTPGVAQTSPTASIRLRSASQMSVDAQADIGPKGASLQASRTKGDNNVAVDAALVWVGTGIRGDGALAGWQPFATLGWQS